jgi:hypothetical protein
MRSIPLARAPKLRCAPFHLSQEADPIGSAGAYDAFLCVEVPLPWGRDISEHEPFHSLGAGGSLRGADGRVWRPQGLVPRGDTAGAVRVLAMDQPERPAAGPYRRREWWVAPEQVSALCRALVDADVPGTEAFEAHRVEVADDVLDVFVCTHGRRDVCCGGSGTSLHEQLVDQLAPDEPVRVWRVSHTGGHRFAPTALTFPDGYGWAHLDLDAALAIARRTGPVAAVADRCRGVSSLEPAAQVADRALLARVGWDWCEATRRATTVSPGGPTRRTDVRLDATLADGAPRSVMVQVELDREIPQPDCGVDEGAIGDETARSPVWRAVRVDPVPPG